MNIFYKNNDSFEYIGTKRCIFASIKKDIEACLMQAGFGSVDIEVALYTGQSVVEFVPLRYFDVMIMGPRFVKTLYIKSIQPSKNLFNF